MARIVYGVMGDSRGHLSRSLAVAGELSRHEIIFAGGGLVETVRQQGYRSISLPMLGTILRNGAVDTMATLANTARELLRRRATLAALRRELEALRPDLVVTDYEYFTPLAARQLGLPCISIDHQHVVTHTRYETPPGQRWNRLCTSLPIRLLFSNAERFLVSSFFAPPVAEPARVELFGPVLRPQPLQYTAGTGEHVLVYLRGASLKAVTELLDGRERRYVIYGFGEGRGTANCAFKKASVDGFLEDLTTAAAVLSNGGHSLLSESFHFGKPVCCVPTGMFYEQYLNAWFVEQLGYGRLMPDIARREILDDFEARIPAFAANLAGKSFHGNAALAARVEALL
ncbi:glycosyltransferase family protein [Megalodesulfovibrio gigas]|uniref:Putative glycosyl transferase, UDP-glucuronosyltransferase n=1 Tax=Megalodesulfovibrio gigas (strain ATCC 19364 / DSM 1382 / NCIMB 9332 / VKM B-1759) TaxID=1121448 RepID=T2GG53_MEGG1|nr:glycosyltransferase family protein [Megalodesulfovibrio gigas]AGW15204.1 putative glycosyl transferase, UDP-glucuronosyltransferase [Megalodesulfovibrio gigas DSM 1382 = ATCC 19364]